MDKLLKDERVMYKGRPGTIEKCVGGSDYIVRMDGGKRVVAPLDRLAPFEVIGDEASDTPTDLPEAPDNIEEPTVEPSGETDGDGEVEGEGEEDAPVGEEGPPKPILSRKKFDGMIKKELYNLAQLYDIPGRGGMNIDQLRKNVAKRVDLQ